MRPCLLPARWRECSKRPSALLLPLLPLLLLLFSLACTRCDAAGASNPSPNPLLRDIERFKRSLALGPNAATSYNLATALLSLGNSSDAVPHLLHALADPHFPGRHGATPHPPSPPHVPSRHASADALMNAGVCFERMGMARDSARAYSASMRLRPGPVPALNLLTGSRSLNPSPQGVACV